MLRSTPSSKSSEGPSPLLPQLNGDPGNLWGLSPKGPKGTRHPLCLMRLLSPAGKAEDSGLHHHPCGPREWAQHGRSRYTGATGVLQLPGHPVSSLFLYASQQMFQQHLICSFLLRIPLFPPTPLYLVRSSSLFKIQFRRYQVSEPFPNYSM